MNALRNWYAVYGDEGLAIIVFSLVFFMNFICNKFFDSDVQLTPLRDI